MRAITPVLLTALLAGCAGPPPEAYVGGTPAAAGVGVGRSTANEPCTLQAQRDGGALFCGTWAQPSGRITRGGPAGADTLQALAASSAWRTGIDARLNCGAPAATTLGGGVPAVAMSCTRRVGGWPQVAMVASVDGTAWFADGILPALPALDRSVLVLAGRLTADAAPAAPPGQDAALFASRLAAQSFGANDVGQYEQLMVAGTRANLAESYVPAEQAYRAALTLQQKALGENDPNISVPLMHLALQQSNAGRTADADAAFARAALLVPRAADPIAVPRLAHYRALHAVNAGRNEDALSLLRQAEAGYAALLPAEVLNPPPRPPGTQPTLGGGDDVVLPAAQQAALISVVETRRYQAIAQRNLGRVPQAEASIRAANTLASAHSLGQRNLTARLYRTTGTVADAEGGEDSAAGLGGMTRASNDFSQSQPGTRPLAATDLLRAAQLQRDGSPGAALDSCRRAARLLRELKSATTADLMLPCLGIYAAAAKGSGAQAVMAEMFEASQLVQGSITGQQIALASARLIANPRDPRVASAIRRQQDAGITLAELERRRDALSEPGPRELVAAGPRTASELAAAITEARSTLADADAALQAAAPNYGQLVQEVAPAADVLAALGPNEAFASMVLGSRGGWVFVLRGNEVSAAPAGLSLPQVTDLVRRVRATIEPGAAGLPRFDTDGAAQLYAGTLGRLQPKLDGAEFLVVAPTGPLLSVPFGMLLTGPATPDALGTAPWLVRRTAVSHVPSPANFVSLRRVAAQPGGNRPWFGFGDFKPVTLRQAERTFPRGACEDSARLFAGLAPLPYARRELDATRTLLGGAASDALLAQSYTAAQVRRADLRGVRVLHFATHALLPTELRCQSEPAIVASAPANAPDASGALLTTADVMAMDLDAEVVVLSACNSGGPGGSTGGESLSGLARAFFYAGARSMMVTHWSVNDQVAAALVANTMRRLREGGSGGVASALRGAELALLDGAGRTMPAEVAHPFYWAPFALIGEGRGPTRSATLDNVARPM